MEKEKGRDTTVQGRPTVEGIHNANAVTPLNSDSDSDSDEWGEGMQSFRGILDGNLNTMSEGLHTADDDSDEELG